MESDSIFLFYMKSLKNYLILFQANLWPIVLMGEGDTDKF